MITFRKIVLEDLDVIYNNNILRPLITTPASGERFAVVIEDDGVLKGGVSGYKEGSSAFIQCVVIQPDFDEDSLFDGLIRSLVYILDREGIKTLFVMRDKNEHLYNRIGFKITDRDNRHYCLMLDVNSFFGSGACR
jgi:N-acetylglutamate synthase-like GNAT family acetyltransferase